MTDTQAGAARVDAHQHFWDLASGRYDWPTEREGPIFRSFGPADHLALVSEVARRHPDLVLVIDHLAKPPFRADGWDIWSSQIREGAEAPTTRAKLSGLDTAAGAGWTVEELRSGFDVALEAFGPDRLLLGSDWSVCRLASSYGDVVRATDALIGRLSPAEQERIMGGTATEVYGLAATSAADGEA